MAGLVKETINRIIAKQSQGNPAAAHFTRTKLILKGINPDAYDAQSADDPRVLRVLLDLEREFDDGRKK